MNFTWIPKSPITIYIKSLEHFCQLIDHQRVQSNPVITDTLGYMQKKCPYITRVGFKEKVSVWDQEYGYAVRNWWSVCIKRVSVKRASTV